MRFLFTILTACILFVQAMPSPVIAAPFIVSDIQSPVVERRVSTLADLQAITGKGSILAVKLMGRGSEGDGGGGTFRWDSSDLSTEVAADTQAGIYVAPTSDLTGASGAWVRMYSGMPDGRWFGMVNDGVTDNATAMSGLINSMPTDAQTKVWVPSGVYAISSEVHINKPVLFICEGNGEISTSVLGTVTPGVTFKWSGAGAGTMFVQSAQTSALMIAGTTTGERLFGGGIKGAVLNGSDLATTGAWLASTYNSDWEVTVRQFVSEGIILDGGNGALSIRNRLDVQVIYGITAATQSMNGVVFREYNGQPSTQNRFSRVWGLLYDGDGVVCADTDNNVFEHIHVTHSGAGRAINFANGSAHPGRNNVVNYIAGDIHAESNSFGNRIIHGISEGQKLTVDSGAQIHYEVVDYVTAGIFKTQNYTMSGVVGVDANAMRPDGANATSEKTTGTLWSGIRLPDSVNGNITFNIPSNQKWNVGAVTKIDLIFSIETVNSGANARFNIKAGSHEQLGSTAGVDIDDSFTVSVDNSINTLNRRTHWFTTAIPFKLDDFLMFKITRLSTDVLDTTTGNVILLGVRVHYLSTGPDSAGSGPYAVTPNHI